MTVIVQKNFLSKEECAQLNDWVDLGLSKKWLDKGFDIGCSWGYTKRLTTRAYGDRFCYPQIVYEVFSKITKHYDLGNLKKSVIGRGRDGVVVSCTFPTGNLYEHKDAMEGDLDVLRCNIMTRKADAGGELFVDGKKIIIEVGDLHCYLASSVSHYVTEVEGETSRVLWMFGYQASKNDFAKMAQKA
jgi:hypothetical protein